jgi:hypothetical protein
MFFRRGKLRVPGFEERIDGLGRSGFAVSPDRARLTRGPCAGLVRENAQGAPEIVRTGILVGGEIGVIVDGGNQKFLVTPSGRKLPALATHLEALHAFTEDLRQALGIVSLYNESLGTVNGLHQYDRLTGR